jgi:hypothetical protein
MALGITSWNVRERYTIVSEKGDTTITGRAQNDSDGQDPSGLRMLVRPLGTSMDLLIDVSDWTFTRLRDNARIVIRAMEVGTLFTLNENAAPVFMRGSLDTIINPLAVPPTSNTLDISTFIQPSDFPFQIFPVINVAQ